MTEENLNQEMDEPEPHAKIDEHGDLWFRDDQGKWSKHEPISTGDPELDTLWDMTPDEVDRLAEDDTHPWQDKAKQVKAEASSTFRETTQSLTRSWIRPFEENLHWNVPGVRWNTWWDDIAAELGKTFGQRIVEGMPKPLLNTKSAFHTPYLDDDEVEATTEVAAEASKMDAAEGTDRVSIGDMFTLVQYMAVSQDEGNAERARMRRDNLEASQDASEWAEKANEWAKKSHGKAQASMWLAASAVIVGLASLAANVFGWGIG